MGRLEPCRLRNGLEFRHCRHSMAEALLHCLLGPLLPVELQACVVCMHGHMQLYVHSKYACSATLRRSSNYSVKVTHNVTQLSYCHYNIYITIVCEFCTDSYKEL